MLLRLYTIFLFIFIIITCPKVNAQDRCNLKLTLNQKPVEHGLPGEYLFNYVQKINRVLKKDISLLDSKYNRETKKYYNSRVKTLESLALNGHLYYDTLLLEKINEIGNILIEANNIETDGRIQWIINKTGVPNASCVGEGTIILNLGLISYLQNFDQLAFVMAHELGHFYLDHVNVAINEEVEFLNNKSLRKKINQTARNIGNSREELLAILETKALSSKKHSRAFELETDSLAFKFYSKAGFPKAQALMAMKLLKTIDQGKYPPAKIKDIFSNLDQEWNYKWTKSNLSGLSLVKPNEEELDKFKTHPSTSLRIEQLKRLGAEEAEEDIDQRWCKFTLQYDIEILDYSYWLGDLFSSFVLSTQLYELNNENVYVQGILTHCLLDILIAKKEHYFSSIVPSPNIRMSEHYFESATFLDNINFSSLKRLVFSFADTKLNLELIPEEVLRSIELKKQFLEGKDISIELNKYLSKYSESKYIKSINN